MPAGWWVGHVAAVIAVATLGIVLGGHGLRRVEIGAWLLAIGGTVVGGLIRGRRTPDGESPLAAFAPYAALVVGMLCLVPARLLQNEGAAIGFAAIGVVLFLTACAMFVRDLRRLTR
jgi:hypothetical protein